MAMRRLTTPKITATAVPRPNHDQTPDFATYFFVLGATWVGAAIPAIASSACASSSELCGRAAGLCSRQRSISASQRGSSPATAFEGVGYFPTGSSAVIGSYIITPNE